MEREKYPEWYVDVKSISPNWITDNFLDFMDLNAEKLKGKNITSIGWWFWIFEMDMAKNWANVTIVDPMFVDKQWIDVKLKENMDWMKEKSRWKNEGKFEKMKSEIIDVLAESKDEKEIAEAQENLQRYNERQAEIEEYLRRRKILMEHLKNWKENQVKYWLILNSSSWDDIKWVDKNSQDVVLIAHTLSHIYNKSDWDIVNFLSEASKILKSDWRFYIIDYTRDIPDVEKVFEKTKLKKYYKVNKWSFVCCFDKKWLDKFLENELR